MKICCFLVVNCVLVCVQTTLYAQDVVAGNAPVAENEITLDDALAELERLHQNHINVLSDLYDRVPESARPGIERAILNSQRGLAQVKQVKGKARGKRQGQAGQDGGRPESAGQGRGGFGQNGGRPESAGQGRGGFGQGGGRPESTGQGRGGFGKGGGRPAGAGGGKR